MKQKILTYFILVTACIGLHSCLFQQDDYFDKSSAERAAADVIKCSELLKKLSKRLAAGILYWLRLCYGRYHSPL